MEEIIKEAEDKIKRECATRMVADGQPLNLVAHCSGLTLEEVEKIAKNHI